MAGRPGTGFWLVGWLVARLQLEGLCSLQTTQWISYWFDGVTARGLVGGVGVFGTVVGGGATFFSGHNGYHTLAALSPSVIREREGWVGSSSN